MLKKDFSPSQDSNIEAQKLFQKFRLPGEQWSDAFYQFYLDEYRKSPKETIKIMLRRSREHFNNRLQPTPPEIQQFLVDLDAYFQDIFRNFFNTACKISLPDITYVTLEQIEHADRIRGVTYLDIDHYHQNRAQFSHLVVHEALHLSISEFPAMMIEEAFIEHCIYCMKKSQPSQTFPFSPVDSIYQEWRVHLELFFAELPTAESYFIQYALSGNWTEFSSQLRNILTIEVKRKLSNSHRRGFSYFLTVLEEMITEVR